jgi:pimeloyl-ACP methyl ester carboxylesterase
MMDDFTTAEIQTGETIIFVRSYGSGPPILLLYGFPQTHLMWRSVAPLLARNFTVVCTDLRGYGRSGCPGLHAGPCTISDLPISVGQRHCVKIRSCSTGSPRNESFHLKLSTQPFALSAVEGLR